MVSAPNSSITYLNGSNFGSAEERERMNEDENGRSLEMKLHFRFTHHRAYIASEFEKSILMGRTYYIFCLVLLFHFERPFA